MRKTVWTVLLFVASCGGGSNAPQSEAPRQSHEEARSTTGDEIVPAPAVADLTGAAEAPPEPEIPADTVALASRMAPRRLDIPRTRRGHTERFVFDGFHRGWFARTPAGPQSLLTPIYGDGKVYVGGGFSSSQVFAYASRTGEREWTASAPDGGPSAAILEDGKILYNTESCTLFAVDAATGRQRWSRWLGDPLMSQPAAANGLVFSGHLLDGQSPGGLPTGTTGYGTGDGRRYGFTAMNLTNGAPRWTRPIDGDVMNAAVLDGDDVFFTTMSGTVYRMNQRSGRVHWRRRLHATSAPWLDGDDVHVTVRLRENGGVREKAVILSRESGGTEHELDAVDAAFVAGRPDPGVQEGWSYEGSRATVVGGRIYQTIGNEVHCRDADTRELLWRRRYTDNPRTRPASMPAIAGSQLVFGTRDGVLFGLDIDTGMTAWAYDVGEPIASQPTIGHGWVYASTTRGGVVGLEVSDVSFDGWHMWGGNAQHNGRVMATEPPADDTDRPTEGTLELGGSARDGEVAGFPLRGTRVTANVSGFVARVSVEQTFHNPYTRPVEAVYLFPLPDDAAVDAMELRAGDRVVTAQIRRRHEARQEYDEARSRGVLASLLEQERPNLFRQSVANIRPGDAIRVTLSYTQALPYEAGSYRFVYPMVAGPRYEGGGEGAAANGVRQVVLTPGGQRPDRVEVSIDADFGVAVADVRSPTHEIGVTHEGDRVHVALTEGARPDRDLDVRFQVAGEAPAVSVLGSPPQGEARGHFSLALHPRLEVADDEVMPRELVFVVDTSSSMHGRPLELAQAAMLRALGGLRPTDTFRVLSFSDTTSALSDAPLPATEENVARGRRFVSSMEALGASEMVRGLRAALDPEGEPGRMRVVLLMTDGFIGNETEVFREVNDRLGQSRVFAFGVGSAVNRYLLTRLAEVGRGDAQVVTLDESPDDAADAFHERIARPFLTDIHIDWGDLQVADAYPRRVPDLYADRPLVVHARYGHGGTGDVTIRGRIAGRPFEQTVSVALPSEGEPRPELESVWARTRIRDLMTAMALRPSDALQEEVTQLGLEHHLLTQWTAFLAIDEGYHAEGEAQTVQQPSETPAGITAPVVAPPRPTMRRARATEASPTRMAPAYGMGGLGMRGSGRGGGGGMEAMDLLDGFGGGSRGDSAAPAAQPDVDAERRGTTETSRAIRGRRPSCYEQARRPDGTIDQAALEDCLRRQRAGGAEKATSWTAPKRGRVFSGLPPADLRRAAP
ncbi:MAG: PQQ-binding-like beta-propeller repeat protein [Sandaracinaceae bacterium]|nr:PQQ-binding-like beta-propeller repeat protein [Sandaracinaceae bacterium]